MIHLFPPLTDDYPSSPDRVNAVEPNENACLPSASMSAGSQSQESANTGEGIEVTPVESSLERREIRIFTKSSAKIPCKVKNPVVHIGMSGIIGRRYRFMA